MIRSAAKAIILAALAASFAPAAAPAQPAPLQARQALYELRVYHAAPGKLADLNTRFRDHTLRLFRKHGMTSVAYWNEAPTPADPNGKVIYILAYPDMAAHDADWKAFRADPEWQKAAAASEANGKLVLKVDSSFMTMTDYSPPLTLGR
ncbi:NIPSNAP family protein [Sphingomonas quercus]|uniref:NIPSNAP family protein n=1 Tax=Sphingomonas quercus TaxID=2842451 RepID=A0ABS6BLR8_9SPHN|nr:NIPSNAP family protein [Sphingomonas quercus]MBU3079259.1 NIPSNAP family protein [Sphingomonas quercus]